jgi:hypothetical protein
MLEQAAPINAINMTGRRTASEKHTKCHGCCHKNGEVRRYVDVNAIIMMGSLAGAASESELAGDVFIVVRSTVTID